MVLPDNTALNQIREVAGQTQDQVSTTSSSNETYGDFLEDNPLIERAERVKSGGSISESELNTSIDKVKESIQESTGNFRETVKDAGVDPNDAFVETPDLSQSMDFGDIWDNKTPDMGDETQKIQDLIYPSAGLMPKIPEFPDPEVNPKINLGLGKVAKYGAVVGGMYLIFKEVL